MKDQLSFDFFEKDSYDLNNYIIMPDNEIIHKILSNSIDSNFVPNIIFLMGEGKTGKTYLEKVFQNSFNAKFLKRGEFTIERYDNYILADLNKNFNEEKLFFLLNSVILNNSRIVITCNFNIKKYKFKIKDLKSRVASAFFFELKNKIDKNYKKIFILKLFSDRQIKINDQTLKYFEKNLPNKYKDLIESVDRIDNSSIAEKKNITVSFVKKIFRL